MPLLFPKPAKRSTLKRKRRVIRAASVAMVRMAVFEREDYRCRCCGRPAKSMHEIVPRSLGGAVSLENSVALCGDGVRGCHGKIQRHEVRIVGSDANGYLSFTGGVQ